MGLLGNLGETEGDCSLVIGESLLMVISLKDVDKLDWRDKTIHRHAAKTRGRWCK